MYTLQNIKDEYYVELSIGLKNIGFDQYLKEYFVQTYDEHLNLLGYERK